MAIRSITMAQFERLREIASTPGKNIGEQLRQDAAQRELKKIADFRRNLVAPAKDAAYRFSAKAGKVVNMKNAGKNNGLFDAALAKLGRTSKGGTRFNGLMRAAPLGFDLKTRTPERRGFPDKAFHRELWKTARRGKGLGGTTSSEGR